MAITHQAMFINIIGLDTALMSIISMASDVMQANIGILDISSKTQNPSLLGNTSLFLHINPSYHTNIILLTSSV